MRVSLLFVASILIAGGGAAQTNMSAGEIAGTVTDPSGALVQNALVTLTSPATGYARTALTDESGAFRFLSVSPGAYDLRVEKHGFRAHLVRDISVTVGQAVRVDAPLEIGPLAQTIEVSGESLPVEAETVRQADTMVQRDVEKLPIDRRDYLTYALLAPGVVDSTALADNNDFRVKQTPTTGLSVYGSNGRGNSVTVDGGEANDDAGGIRPTVSQEAVQEFQINRSNYSAELGSATGAVVNIVTKSGGNRAHGSLFGFFRADELDAADQFARVVENDRLRRVKPPSSRQQFGASVGLPLVKDRTFLFAAFEGLRRNESSTVSVLTDASIFQPTPAQEAILRGLDPAASARLRSALTSGPETIALFANNSGMFPYTSRNQQFSARLDHRHGNADQFYFRYSYADWDEANANLRALVGASRGTRVEDLDSTSLAHWTHAFSANALNEASFQWSYSTSKVVSSEKFGPEININGFGYFNRDLNLPSYKIRRRYEFRDGFSWARGNHKWKFGGEMLARGAHVDAHALFSGRFTFGELPGSLVDPALAATPVTALQAFNLGLAQTYQQGFGDPIVSATIPYYAAYVQDNWKPLPNLTLEFGLRYELDDRRDPLRTDRNNFSPRFGFAWDPFGDQKTAVRGGYGIFHGPIFFQLDYVVNALGVIDGRRQIAQVFTTIQTPGQASAANIFSRLRGQGVLGIPAPVRMITTADLEQFGLRVSNTGPTPPLSVLFENSADFANPYSQQASFGVERQIGREMTVAATYTWVRTLNIMRARDRNLLPAPVDPVLGIRVWSPQYFADPLLAQVNVYESTGQAFYRGLAIEFKKRFSGRFGVSASYTLSRATDEVVDYNSDFQANDQINMRAERARSSFDQRHKLSLFGYWLAPYGFEIAPVIRAASGRPFNLLAGVDLNRDRHSTTDRPIGAGRNTGLGPRFWTCDLRVARQFGLGDSRSLELMAEGFNLLNRSNFASINNTVGNVAPPFDVEGRRDRGPSEPLGFTSVYAPRRIQLGIRLRF